MKESSVQYATRFLKPGFKDVLEFGVWTGISLRQIRNKLDKSYRIMGFDSFVGLPEDWVDGNGKLVGQGKKGRFSTKGKTPDIKGVEFFVGWFENTIPDYLKNPAPIALLHVDCDLYSSTKTVLWSLNEYIQPGTIIVFDEWCYNHDPKYNDHEQKAFYEWVKDCKRKFEIIDYVDPTDITKKHKYSERKIISIIE